MHNLGLLFLDGNGTPRNEVEGYRWIKMSADAGDPLSQFLIGTLLIQGRGVSKNTNEGIAWIKKSADAGNANALAKLGQDYYFGDDGLPKDLSKAVPLIKSAAEKGNPWACQTLGLLYLRGDGVPKDDDESSKWLTKSHQHGN